MTFSEADGGGGRARNGFHPRAKLIWRCAELLNSSALNLSDDESTRDDRVAAPCRRGLPWRQPSPHPCSTSIHHLCALSLPAGARSEAAGCELQAHGPLAPNDPRAEEIELTPLPTTTPSGPHDQPSSAATPAPATTPASSSLHSPSAAPFYPSAGRGKALRWADGSPTSEGSAASYRDVLLRASPPRVPALTPTPAPAPSPTPAPPARSVHDRLGPHVRPGHRPARCRGRTELVHGLPVRLEGAGYRRPGRPLARRVEDEGPGRCRSYGVFHQRRHARHHRARHGSSSPRTPDPPDCDNDGFTTVVGKRSRRRRRQRLTQYGGKARSPPVEDSAPRRRPEQEGRCLNCLSANHLL